MKEAHRLIADQLSNLQARQRGLRVATVRELDLRVGNVREVLLVRVPEGLTVPYQDDALWAVSTPVASLSHCGPPAINASNQIQLSLEPPLLAAEGGACTGFFSMVGRCAHTLARQCRACRRVSSRQVKCGACRRVSARQGKCGACRREDET